MLGIRVERFLRAFYDKWEPADWPPITVPLGTKREFMRDLRAVATIDGDTTKCPHIWGDDATFVGRDEKADGVGDSKERIWEAWRRCMACGERERQPQHDAYV